MQKQIDIKQLPALGNLSVRGRGYLEAFAKILEGRRLFEAGTLELEQLERASGKSLSGDGGAEVTESVLRLKGGINMKALKDFLKDGPLSSHELATRMGRAPGTIRRILVEDIEICRVGVGNKTKWALKGQVKSTKTIAAKVVRRVSRKSDTLLPIDEKEQEADNAAVLDYLKKHPKSSMQKIQKGLGRSFYPIKRAILNLEAQGKIWKSSSNKPQGGKLFSWELLNAK